MSCVIHPVLRYLRCEAGAHLEVPIRVDGARTAVRRYSICSDPARRDAWEIDGTARGHRRGGSRAVHEWFEIGLRLRCGLPQNHFAPHADARPAVLMAGGDRHYSDQGDGPGDGGAPGLAMQVHYAVRNETGNGISARAAAGSSPPSLTTYSSAEGERMDIERI